MVSSTLEKSKNPKNKQIDDIMRVGRKKRTEKIKKIFEERMEQDLVEFGAPKSRSLHEWLLIINYQLTRDERFGNLKELSSFFRMFRFEKTWYETRDEGCFRRILFYRYIGGQKNGMAGYTSPK